MGVNEILIGIFTAAFLMFLRSANVTANRQKVTAIQLKGYLSYWQQQIIEHDFFSIYYFGVKWNKEIKELVKNGGSAEDIVKLNEEKKKTALELKEAIESEPPEVAFNKELTIRSIENIPKNVLDNLMAYALSSEQNLVDGKTFVSDEAASHLDPYSAQVCIELKMKLIALISPLVILILRVAEDGKGFEPKNYAQEISELTWKAILVSKDIDALSTSIEKYISKSVFTLTLDNVGL